MIDVLIYDTVSSDISEDAATKPMGGSEYELLQMTREFDRLGITWVILRQPPLKDLGAACKTLIVSRYSPIPQHVSYDRLVVKATDAAPREHDHQWSSIYADLVNRFVCVSEWQRSLFAVECHARIDVIPAMIDDHVLELGRRITPIPNRWCYASAAMKGLEPTLRTWREIKIKHPAWLGQLAITTNWDSPPAGMIEAYAEFGVEFHGRLSPAHAQRFIAEAEGLFYVNEFPETYCAVAAVAAAMGRRLAIHCLGDEGGLPETIHPNRSCSLLEMEEVLGLLPPKLWAISMSERPKTVSRVFPRWLEVLELKSEANVAQFNRETKAIEAEMTRRDPSNYEKQMAYAESYARAIKGPLGAREVGRIQDNVIYETTPAEAEAFIRGMGEAINDAYEPPNVEPEPHLPIDVRVASIYTAGEGKLKEFLTKPGRYRPIYRPLGATPRAAKTVELEPANVPTALPNLIGRIEPRRGLPRHRFDGGLDDPRFNPIVDPAFKLNTLEPRFGARPGLSGPTQTASESVRETRTSLTKPYRPPTSNKPASTQTVANINTSIGLVIIAKNEAAVLPRAIKSTSGIVDRVTVILDQANTDTSVDVVPDAVPGSIYNECLYSIDVAPTPFAGLAAARNEAVEIASKKWGSGFVLMLDADDVIEQNPNLPRFKPDPAVDGYMLTIHDGPLRYARLVIFRPDRGFTYTGVAHETLVVPPGARIEKCNSLIYRRLTGGAGSANPEAVYKKYMRDVGLLEADLERDPDNARSRFYLAQSYADASGALVLDGGHKADLRQKAFENYMRRITMAGWVEEVFVSHMRAADLAQGSDVVKPGLWLRAAEVLPARATEALTNLMIHFNHRKAFHLAEAMGHAVPSRDMPVPDGLFVDSDSYTWRLAFEHAVAVFYSGNRAGARDLFIDLLTRAPEHAKPSIQINVDLCEKALSGNG